MQDLLFRKCIAKQNFPKSLQSVVDLKNETTLVKCMRAF